jgi:hypothetical protein
MCSHRLNCAFAANREPWPSLIWEVGGAQELWRLRPLGVVTNSRCRLQCMCVSVCVCWLCVCVSVCVCVGWSEAWLISVVAALCLRYSVCRLSLCLRFSACVLLCWNEKKGREKSVDVGVINSVFVERWVTENRLTFHKPHDAVLPSDMNSDEVRNWLCKQLNSDGL